MPADHDCFIHRHIGPTLEHQAQMLAELGFDSLDALIRSTVPPMILRKTPLQLPPPQNEYDALAQLEQLSKRNQSFRSYIGMGYYPTHVPPVILRNVLENPGWYTAYTPYQAEISQGRLEGLLNFQHMVMDLTGMELANASMLDEATAAAEAMALCKRVNKQQSSHRFFVAQDTHPQTIAVLKTRAETYGFELIIAPLSTLATIDVFGALIQYPGTYGDLHDLASWVSCAHERNSLVVVAADLMSLVCLKPPGEYNVDVVVGNSQRFGVPMGFGGPHAAFFATRDAFKRSVPGRIIGVSKDRHDNPALRMAIQTREQHIRREKATSNICTAQALLAIMAGFFAVYHGPKGLRTIAHRIHRLTCQLANVLKEQGIHIANQHWFDTLTLEVGDQQQAIVARALAQQINLRVIGHERLGISLDETTTVADIEQLATVITGQLVTLSTTNNTEKLAIAVDQRRTTDFLCHPVFNRYHAEISMLRYLKQLENKDITLTHSMIPLGSCTMKLNATVEMLPVSWPTFANIHPFVPQAQVSGYIDLFQQLEKQLMAITGFAAISLQPNSGAQGEYAGLLAIHRYHQSRGDAHRRICFIPRSAHGTNPASATIAGMKIVIIDCDDQGNIDIDDLEQQLQKYGDQLAAIMITYPSTHGVFEENIQTICALVHQQGGQVYIDGANLNALVGIVALTDLGADVAHINLHKTFCIPHGGGGPGMGPIGVGEHLAPFLPNHPVQYITTLPIDNDTVSAATWGSPAILPISWMYITLMGNTGLKKATQVAILSANYIANRLSHYYPILYTGRHGRVAHECIIDLRPIKKNCGITEEDIAKRLIDYGFHAPTMAFPVPGTLMIEPTESEPKTELDRFIDAMISIRREIKALEVGDWNSRDNPLCNAPHTSSEVCSDHWPHSYSKEQAAFPIKSLHHNKYWPPVGRIDNVYGDKHLFCSCPVIDDYQEP